MIKACSCLSGSQSLWFKPILVSLPLFFFTHFFFLSFKEEEEEKKKKKWKEKARAVPGIYYDFMSAWGANMHMEWKSNKKNGFCSLGGICYMRNITLFWLPRCSTQALNLYFVYKKEARIACVCTCVSPLILLDQRVHPLRMQQGMRSHTSVMG